MSTIFEIFGYRLDDDSAEAIEHRKRAWCPFMDRECNGGGNRHQTEIDLTKVEFAALQELYPERAKIMPGVCSLQVEAEKTPWIVCPNRLLALQRQKAATRNYQEAAEKRILQLLKYPPGTRIGVWSEVKIEENGEKEGIPYSFDYRFDYILVPLVNIAILSVMRDILGSDISNQQAIDAFRKALLRSKYVIEGDEIIDFPHGRPTIVEIMTSSTSGSNKGNRSQIGQAFEDALTKGFHTAPSVNYRQVWSRMVGQLFVKSEVALEWGGATIWILQDRLANYINATTRLNINQFIKDELEEVNLLSFGYDSDYSHQRLGAIELQKSSLYAGKITSELSDAPSFVDIVRAAVKPQYKSLIEKLIVKQPPSSIIIAPE